MNYKIKRGEEEFGPYSLVDLKRYVSEGRIAPTDLAKSEGMDEWAPVSQVTGDMEIPEPAARAGGDAGIPEAAPGANLLPPPNLHWGLLLLLMFVTCGIFGIIWMFIQANWVRKVDPGNSALVLYSISIGAAVVAIGMQIPQVEELQALAGLVNIAGSICTIVGYFKLRSGLHDYYGGPPIHLQLGPVMTFFFNSIYFQYHFTRINEWHQTGRLRA